EKPVVHIVRRVAPPQLAETDPGYEGAQRRQVQTLFADWTPPNLEPHDENVEVYSNCGEVELSLNGKTLGSKPLPTDAAPRVWRVNFEPGAIDAACKDGTREELRTASNAAKIVLSVNRPRLRTDWDDVAYITATVTDPHDVVVPGSEATLAFEIAGPGA